MARRRGIPRGDWFVLGCFAEVVLMVGLTVAALRSCTVAFDGDSLLRGLAASAGIEEPMWHLQVPGEIELVIPGPGVYAVMLFGQGTESSRFSPGADGRLDRRPAPDVEWTITPAVPEVPPPSVDGETGWLRRIFLYSRVRFPAGGRYRLRAQGPAGALLVARETPR